MKLVLASIFLCLLAGCASKPNDSMQDPSQVKADIRAREDFAKSLPKPADR
jgi:type IV pilus biogenesis protein CpaD/CtpE